MPVLPSNLNTVETQEAVPSGQGRASLYAATIGMFFHALGTPALSLITIIITYQRCGKVEHEYTHFTFQFNFK